MPHSIQPLQFLLILLAGWINRRQLAAIDYLKEENRPLSEDGMYRADDLLQQIIA